ncbi:hypothetical protein R7E47_01920 [Vibrio sp. Vb1026]|uniref:hypothetical protein n=1 Tax=Vibrio sp. Vb1026 TaxID=3074637 RepID=UPI0029647B8C|nr:hypothetical protein [Vibrio sp. Vb1026]EJN3798998.1 hypothetical protein [Vibrio alginolyticus]MDW1873662.1 hypothetical protein [Vibrio sp. Vb1026]
MGVVNNQNSSVQSTNPPVNKQLTKLISSLGDHDGLNYFCYIASQYGFSTAGRWSTLQQRIASDIQSTSQDKIRCTEDNLEKAIDRFISQADHIYQIVELDQLQASAIRKKIAQLGNKVRTSDAAKLYPCKFKFTDGQSYPIGFSLCKVSDLGDGYALVYSSVKVKRVYNRFDEYSQWLHTVFIPHACDRVEYRLSSNLPKRSVNDEMKELKTSFINDLEMRHSGADSDTINFFNAIQSLFDDTNVGRVSWGRVATFEEKPYQSSSASNDPGHCCRPELMTHKLSANNNTYHPWQMILQIKYNQTQDEEMHLEFSPGRQEWRDKKCYSLTIREPKDSMTLSNTLSNIISRS